MQQALWRGPFRFWPGGILSSLGRWKKQWFLNSSNSHHKAFPRPLMAQRQEGSLFFMLLANKHAGPASAAKWHCCTQPLHQCRVSSIGLKLRNSVTICCVPCVLLQFLGRSCQPCPWAGSFVAEGLASIFTLPAPWNKWKSLLNSEFPHVFYERPLCVIPKGIVWKRNSVIK